MQKNIKNISGNRYGRLVALYAVSAPKADGGAVVWRCRCDCGKEVNAMYTSLLSGNKKSCGCLRKKNQKNLAECLELVDGTCVEWIKDRTMRADNKSGHKGVFKKKNGKYSAFIGFKKKTIYLGTFDSFEKAVEARERAEEAIYASFLEGHRRWKKRAALDPAWAKKHPFRFDVEKKDGQIMIREKVEIDI